MNFEQHPPDAARRMVQADQTSGNTTAREARHQSDWALIERIWPDGTWLMPWGDSRPAQMDDVTRSVLLDCWEAQDRLMAEQAPVLPARPCEWAAGPIPVGWKPSAALLRQRLAACRADEAFALHVLDRLAQMAQLKP